MGNNRIRIEWLEKNDRNTLYAKYALMELARAGNIDFVKIKPSRLTDDIMPESALAQLNRNQSFLTAHRGHQSCRIILDSTESFFYLSPLVADVDLYFFSAFNEDLFEKHRFLSPYPWQERCDLSFYKKIFEKMEGQLGSHFHKIVRFIPIPMVMDLPARRLTFAKQAVVGCHLLARSILKRFSRYRLGRFDPELHLFRMRYRLLENYRNNPLRYDVVLRDSLFAWPWHRALLHRALEKLDNLNIYQSLSSEDTENSEAWWKSKIPESEIDDVLRMLKKKTDFPENFEEMITSSRLSVLATGKHWGWRALMYVCILCGGPLLMDKPLFEPYFPMRKFKIFYTKNEWTDLESLLRQIDAKQWQNIRDHNQKVFDKYLAPLPVAHYICQTIEKWMDDRAHDSLQDLPPVENLI